MRLPLWPTLFTLVALPMLIALGLWQLERAAWKESLLSRLTVAAQAPMRDVGMVPLTHELAFRPVRMVVQCPKQKPIQRAGEAQDGRSGYAQQLLCKAPMGEDMLLVAGWSERIDPLWQPPTALTQTGTLVAREGQVPKGSLVADPAIAH